MTRLPAFNVRHRRLRRRNRGASAVVAASLVAALVVLGPAAHPAAATGSEMFVPCSGPGRTGTEGNLQTLRDAIVTVNTNAGPDRIVLSANCTYTFTDVYVGAYASWFGPAALPAISSDITIEGNGATIARSSSTVAQFRLLAITPDPGSPTTLGYTSMGAGALTVRDLTLANGLAHGGNGGLGAGGGAGMGGAIFNQGNLTLERVTIRDSVARGGDGAGLSNGGAAGGGGGGMGVGPESGRAGGFGYAFLSRGALGGNGGTGSPVGPDAGSGGGGGGFRGYETGAAGTNSGTAGAGGGSVTRTGTGGKGGSVPGRGTGGVSGDGSGGGGAAPGASSLSDDGGTGGGGGGFGFGGFPGATGTGGLNPGSPGGGGGGGGVGGGGGAGGTGAYTSSPGNTGGAGGAGGGGGFGGGGGSGGFGGQGGAPDIISGKGGSGGNGAQGGAGGFGGGGGGGGRSGTPGAGTPVGDVGTPGAGSPGGFGAGDGTGGVFDYSGAGGGGAGMGGGIFNAQGHVTLHNTTLSGNEALGGVGGGDHLIAGHGEDGQGLGGALFNLNGTVDADSATIAFNQAKVGGGIYNLGYVTDDGGACSASACSYDARTTLVNSIVSNSTDASGQGISDVIADRPATVSNGGTNLVPSVVELSTADGGHDIVRTSSVLGNGVIAGTAITADPKLAPALAANTPTPPPPNSVPFTHAIDRTSPAFDAGATALTSDERGAARPSLAQDDIGAFEFTLITPSLSVVAQPAAAGLGSTARAEATLTGGAQTTGTVTMSLYGPGDASCAGAPVSTSTTRLAGGTTLSSYSPALTEFGTYRWKASYSGDANNLPVLGSCGDATVVVGKARTTLNVGALPAGAALGDKVQDAASLGDTYGSPTGTITFDLYAPSDANCTGTPIFTSTIPVVSSQARSAEYTTAAIGAHHWVASYSGDANNAAVSGSCGDANQTLTVAFRPTLNATAVPATAPLGTPVRAEATLVGATNPTGTVTFELYAPTDTNCYGPIFTSTVNLSPSATATSGTFTPTLTASYVYKGTYRWQATYSGDANNPPSVPQACGGTGRTVEVGKATPTLVGKAAPESAYVGAAVADTATLSNAANPGGLITFEAFADAACTNRVFVNSKSAGEQVVTSNTFRPGEGTYYWRVSFGGDNDNEAVAVPCGAANQTLTMRQIVPAITISQLLPDQATVGQPTSAKAILSGGSRSGRVYFVAYGPGAPGEACNTAHIVHFSMTVDGDGESTEEVTGDGTFTSGVFTPTAPGTYWWSAHYTPTNTITGPANEECGPNSALTVTEPVAPGAPTIGTAVAGGGSAKLSWTAPTETGGAPITGYVVTPYVGATAKTPRTFDSTATTQTINGLQNGTSYTFKVAAKNTSGAGADSAASNAVVPSGTYFLRNQNSSGPSIGGFGFGSPGDIAVVGDWDGNGTTTIGVYRPSINAFFLRNQNSWGPSTGGFRFGSPGDIPVVGDWDGNGTTTIGVYRPSTGVFFLRNQNSSGPSIGGFAYGSPGDIPVVGDWDGNGTTTVGTFRPSSATWNLRNANSAGPSTGAFSFGSPGDVPVVGDWDGNQTTTVGVFRPSTAVFFLRNQNSAGASIGGFRFGSPGDVPLAGDWDGNDTSTVGLYR